MSYNDIGDESTFHLASHIPYLSLRTLNLREDPIGWSRMREMMTALAPTLALYGLHTLDLSYTGLTDAGMSILLQQLETRADIRSLNLEGNLFSGVSTHRTASLTQHNSCLTSLNLSRNEDGGPNAEYWHSWMSLPNTTLLSLQWAGVGVGDTEIRFADGFAAGLACLISLTYLDLHDGGLTGRSVDLLIQTLRQCSRLTHLDLSNNELGHSISSIPKHCTQLRRLELNDCRLNSAGAQNMGRYLSRCTALSWLNLEDNHIEPQGALRLLQAGCSSITYLNLAVNRLGLQRASALGTHIQRLVVLTHLDLSYNELGSKGTLDILHQLTSMTSLLHLSLEGNHINDTGSREIATSLHQIPSLRQLDLFHNPIGRRGAAALQDSRSNCVILSLNHLIS